MAEWLRSDSSCSGLLRFEESEFQGSGSGGWQCPEPESVPAGQIAPVAPRF